MACGKASCLARLGGGRCRGQFHMSLREPKLTFSRYVAFLAPLLLQKVLERVRSPSFTQAEFDIFKASLQRSYDNAAKDSPLRQSMSVLSSIIYEKYTPPQKLA